MLVSSVREAGRSIATVRTMGSALSCSQRTEEGDCLAWWTGSGMSGAPMTPSMSCSSPRLMEQGSPAPERSAACGRIHALTLVQPNLDPREPPPPPPENISSGIGTSSTVSSASSRSRFGQSFLIGRPAGVLAELLAASVSLVGSAAARGCVLMSAHHKVLPPPQQRVLMCLPSLSPSPGPRWTCTGFDGSCGQLAGGAFLYFATSLVAAAGSACPLKNFPIFSGPERFRRACAHTTTCCPFARPGPFAVV